MSNLQYTNDLSLLRPFDLEAAKKGEKLTDAGDLNSYLMQDFVQRNSTGDLRIDVITNDINKFEYQDLEVYYLRMKPLTWVEGKPVYKGDVLWYKDYYFSISVECINPYDNAGLKGTIADSDGKFYKTGEPWWAPIDKWSWNKPKQKVKRKIWVNVYGGFSTVYDSKEEADFSALEEGRIACVETEIEYETL